MKKHHRGKSERDQVENPLWIAYLTEPFLMKVCAAKSPPMMVAHLMVVRVKGNLKMYLP